jgi:hypothetical protein
MIPRKKKETEHTNPPYPPTIVEKHPVDSGKPEGKEKESLSARVNAEVFSLHFGTRQQ